MIAVKWWNSLVVYLKNRDWSRLLFRNMDHTKIRWPFRALLHPFEAASDIKYEKKGSLFIANVFMLLLFILQALEYTATGYLFNFNRLEDFNLLLTFFQSVLLIVLWCVSNWLMCSITGGEGKFIEIWIITWYATLPRLLLSPIAILLSRVLVLEESMFLTVINAIGMGWFLLLVFFGMIVVHQYSASKALLTVLLTLFCMAMICFIGVLFFSFFQQMLLFLQSVFKELSGRL